MGAVSRIKYYFCKILNKILYFIFGWFVKLRQFPTVLREKNPVFLSDETVTDYGGNTFAIVVKYAKSGLGKDFVALLSALRKADIKPIVVCNGTLSDEDCNILRAHAHRILVRPNIGRDMGAYRAATLHLHRSGLKPERVLYLNDSVYYLAGPHLEAMIDALKQDDFDVVGTFENHEFAYHLGSFCFSISGKVFSDEHIQKFWVNYAPYDLRPHAIHKGEIGFSRALKRAGYRADVVYSADNLVRRLSKLEIENLIDLLRFMGPKLRAQSLESIMQPPLSAIKIVPNIGHASLKQPPSNTPTIREYQGSWKDYSRAVQRENDLRKISDALARQLLIDSMIRDVTSGSQIHLGFGLFHRVMGCPIVKKDLLFRGIYLEHDCSLILDEIPDEDHKLIMRELISRGRNLNLPFYERFLLGHGLI